MEDARHYIQDILEWVYEVQEQLKPAATGQSPEQNRDPEQLLPTGSPSPFLALRGSIILLYIAIQLLWWTRPLEMGKTSVRMIPNDHTMWEPDTQQGTERYTPQK